MNLVMAALAACSLASVAHADRAHVAGGIHLGVDHFLNAAWLLEGGVRLGDRPVAIHASAAKGGALDADSGGDFWRLTAGVEYRAYGTGDGFGFVGAEGGYQHQTWNPSDPFEAEVHHGPVVGLRAGYEGGGEHVRVRAAVDAYRYRRHFVDHMTAWQPGLATSLAVGYRW